MIEDKTPVKVSFYAPAYSPEETAALHNPAPANGLEDEITAVRITIRRTLQALKGELEPADFARLADLVFRGANTAGSLVKAQRMIDGASADALIGSVAQILLELRDEQGWEI